MDTTAKGNLLEDQISDSISRMINEGRFFAQRDHCRVFQKKGYYSKDREREIIFDIAIEMYLPGQDTLSMLVLIECKNYTHSVPVDDVEEFYAKIQQITPANTKAIIATGSSFQSGAFAFARSKGMGLIRYFSTDSLEWVLTRAPSSASTGSERFGYHGAERGLHTQDFVSRYFDFYCYADDNYSNSFSQCVEKLARNEADESLNEFLDEVSHVVTPPSNLVPYMEAHEIEDCSRQLLDAVGYEGGRVPLEAICALFEKDRGWTFRSTTLAPGVLGTISFQPQMIEFDEHQAGNSSRLRFTQAHELGHLCLGHGQYLIRDVCRDYDVELENPPQIQIKDITHMEWQANYFAACLLLPRGHLRRAVLKQAQALGVADHGFGLIYLDDQECNLQMYYSMTSQLVREFDVSRSVLKICLKDMGLLNEADRRSVALAHTVASSLRRP